MAWQLSYHAFKESIYFYSVMPLLHCMYIYIYILTTYSHSFTARTRNSIAVSSFDHMYQNNKRPHSIISISSTSSSSSSHSGAFHPHHLPPDTSRTTNYLSNGKTGHLLFLSLYSISLSMCFTFSRRCIKCMVVAAWAWTKLRFF